MQFRTSRTRRSVSHLLVLACALSLVATDLAAQATEPPLPAYRYRLLGVYDEQSGEPVDGAEIVDMLTKMSALTTKTGTLSLFFLPDGGSVVRIRKLGYQPITLTVAISPTDTTPVTVTLLPAGTTLPTVVTTDSAPHYVSPKLREFEDRRKTGFGQFITEDDLRKRDGSKMSDVVRRFTGMTVTCRGSVCRASSTRPATLRGTCPVVVYIDGNPATDNNLEQLNVNEYAAVEFYAGGATMPPQYNRTGSSCGVMLFWTRDR